MKINRCRAVSVSLFVYFLYWDQKRSLEQYCAYVREFRFR